VDGTSNSGSGAPRWVFSRPRQFAWKTALLAATTVSLVPILLWQHVLAAKIYLAALIVVHVVGIGIIAIGVRRHDIAPDRRGLVIRLVGITLLVALLYLASGGVRSTASGLVFWGALFAIWALHTLGLALLHLKGRREAAACPFV